MCNHKSGHYWNRTRHSIKQKKTGDVKASGQSFHREWGESGSVKKLLTMDVRHGVVQCD